MTHDNEPLPWMLWHPQQGLWNAGLLERIRRVVSISLLYKLIREAIIACDSVILLLRAMVRRVRLLGPAYLFARATVPDDIPVCYLDLGTHKEGAELAYMVHRVLPRICTRFTAYGFEASRESFQSVSAKFAHESHVSIHHKALCHAVPHTGTIRLYKDAKRGYGDSLYRQGDSYEDVEATRLSHWLHDNNITLESTICLLRMNIEGAEFDIIKDLVESGLAGMIDGYYGMWDDSSKIDKQRGDDFRVLLAANHICPFTFNGRDMGRTFRLKCIAYDINTAVHAGLRKFERRGMRP
jgi:FkbM family methyltransferase